MALPPEAGLRGWDRTGSRSRGLIRPASGEIQALGADPGREAGIRRHVGYLPGELALYQDLSARGLLEWMGRRRGAGVSRRAPGR